MSVSNSSKSATILVGGPLADEIRASVAEKVAARVEQGLPRPGLATLLVGENEASRVYVRGKHRASEQVGMLSLGRELPASATQDQIVEVIEFLNAEAVVHGILVQLPLPPHLDETRILAAIDPLKDVDGLHPYNAGLLAQKGREPLLAPATPSGILRLLAKENIELRGMHAVIIGRSNIVGLPLASMLIKADATVTVAHSYTQGLPALCRSADLLVAAVGLPEFVRADWVKPGAVVIDVGVNRVEDARAKRGYRLVGDVAFGEVSRVARAISPVPGGVGPMTIAMLLENTLHAAEYADR
ncbi:MAG: bifunctional 5,10-methylenetetrahydrofolate dehydrogenase/5,10-methenyltetrahydrofolate cyclohydrolase [Chloroflexi bacterium]|nr:bifunctional 5,10-methylenetetrahydrofolate dehydrogenase/5,10-methenyltetrahydrofolate cyclohydrolase [Chloroflexota bacterium]MQC27325.1 bifunctional 5,10-methylenetetrahydrofolate dehydrogenase/5,10-methenyltetrahydrofolate cyclohydrolase [Chloroflexota bacterium]